MPVEMPIDMLDKRVSPRSQYFLLQTDGEPVSFYSFRPEDAVDAVPALVVDLSDGGLQILTANPQELTQESYMLELVINELVGHGNKYAVHSVWSRPNGVNLRTGFAFDQGVELAEEVKAILTGTEHRVLRCVLYPN